MNAMGEMEEMEEINEDLQQAFSHTDPQGNRVTYVSGQPIIQDIQGEQDLTRFVAPGGSRGSRSRRSFRDNSL